MRFDMPDYFSAGIKAAVASSMVGRRGRVGIREWRELEREFRRATFRPWDYYLLRLCLERPAGDADTYYDLFANSVAHGHYFDDDVQTNAKPKLRADAWAPWLRRMRSGHLPHVALDLEAMCLGEREEELGVVHD